MIPPYYAKRSIYNSISLQPFCVHKYVKNYGFFIEKNHRHFVTRFFSHDSLRDIIIIEKNYRHFVTQFFSKNSLRRLRDIIFFKNMS